MHLKISDVCVPFFSAESHFIIPQFIYSNAEEHLGCFYIWVTVDNAAVTIHVQIYVQI